MSTYELVAQGIGIVAMAMNCVSYQQKTQKCVLFCQLFGSVLFAVNFLMLGAIAGGLLNLIGVFRAVVFLYGEKLRAKHLGWLISFSSLYVLSYVLVFSVFGKEPSVKNLMIELLPVIGMVLTTVSFRFANAKMTRRFGIFSSPLWLTYNLCSFAVGAIICETVSLISIVVGTVRHDLKKKNRSKVEEGK
ncbi:MAG: YgjV family protein [Clostridia bacterium]|nr:YgjV family protein [Clostridia bacterium]